MVVNSTQAAGFGLLLKRAWGCRLVESGGHADGLSADLQNFVALLVDSRAAYQTSLIATAQARKQLDADIKAVRNNAEQDSRRFMPDGALLNRFSQAWRQYGEHGPDSAPPAPPRDLADAEKAWSACVRRCNEALEEYRRTRRSWEATRTGLFQKKVPEPHLSKSFQRDLWTLQRIQEAYPDVRAASVRMIESNAIPRLKAAFEADAAARSEQLSQVMRENLGLLQMGVDLLGVSGQPWENRLTGPVELSAAARALTRLGTVDSGLPHPYNIAVPCVIDFPSARGLAIQAPMQFRSRGLELLRSVVLRTLMDFPPGQLRLSLIDPTAIGQTFAEFIHLGDYDERLTDTGVKTSAQSIERCLTELTAHLETAISKYLRGQFRDIRDYNRHAGEVAEPYRLIVIADYPRQFSDRAAEQLLSLIENGPRCGIYTVLLYAPEEEEPRGVPFARLTQTMDVVSFQNGTARVRVGSTGQLHDFAPDACPPIAFSADGHPATPAAAFIEKLGLAAKRGTDVVVTLENFLPAVSRSRIGALPEFRVGAPPLSLSPDSWWSASTAELAVAPIGRSGAQGVASMFFSSTTVAGGAIMVGLPRSGKTTSLHAMILTMSMLYSPEELELYLIDAKHGVEFKAYEGLPHARMVSVHSEREFSLAVLRSIQAKVRERAELIKNQGSGLSNITEYRRATAQPLSRIVVVVDEFHELFEEADNVGMEAFAAFSDIVRMGPFSGIHIVVASQTLSSMPAMDRQTLLLLPQRVAFMCNEYDSEIVMGDTNKAPRLLSKTGEGLFNPSRGDESRNQPFAGLYVPPEQRAQLLRELRLKADAEGWTRHPRVFDGDAVVARPRLADVLKTGNRFTVPVGEPFTLAECESLVVPRTRGANILLVGDRDDEQAPDYGLRGVLHSVLDAAAAQSAGVTVIDFVGDEDINGGLTIMDVAQATGARYARSALLPKVLADYAGVIHERTECGNYKAPTQLLVLFGLQRALALAPYDPYSMGDTEEPPLGQLLAAIIANGPEVGVHVVADADRARSVEIRLGTDLLDDFTLRIAGSAADQKDLSLVSGSYGDVPPLRYGQLLIGDLLKGSVRRARGYKILTATPGV